MSDLFLKALKCKNHTGQVPIWIMRQAGRYLPEYRVLREKYPFEKMVHTPELAAEVTLLPIKRFELDAAILFSDILIIAEALGMELHFVEGKGPLFSQPLSTVEQVQNLQLPNVPHSLSHISETIQILKQELQIPLIGFCGGPFTVASYMIEGGSSKDFKKTKQWLFQDADSFRLLLNRITETTIDYLQMQIDAGVDAIQIFESWGNLLALNQFSEFSVHYVKKIIHSLKSNNIPFIYFSRGTSSFAKEMVNADPQALSLDWSCCLKQIRETIGKHTALQGNLDPHLLYSPIPLLQKEARLLLQTMKSDPGYIFNLGHGILPDIPIDSVKALVECVKCA